MYLARWCAEAGLLRGLFSCFVWRLVSVRLSSPLCISRNRYARAAPSSPASSCCLMLSSRNALGLRATNVLRFVGIAAGASGCRVPRWLLGGSGVAGLLLGSWTVVVHRLCMPQRRSAPNSLLRVRRTDVSKVMCLNTCC